MEALLLRRYSGRMKTNWMARIMTNPATMAGKPVIKGTRIPVDLVVRMMAQGLTEQQVLAEYPRLTRADIRAALNYAAAVVANEDVFPLAASA